MTVPTDPPVEAPAVRPPGAYAAPAAMLAAVLAGVAWGKDGTMFPSCTLAAMASVILTAAGCFERPPGARSRSGTALAVALAAYAAALVVADPFLHIRDAVQALVKFTLLIPLAIGLRQSVRRRAWLSAAGAAVLLAASVALLVFNSDHAKEGCGFLGSWVS